MFKNWRGVKKSALNINISDMPIDCNTKYERAKNVEAEHGTDTSAVRKIKTAAVMAAENTISIMNMHLWDYADIMQLMDYAQSWL